MERKLVNIDLQRHRRCRISSINDTDDRLRSARFVERSTGRPGLRHGIKVIDMEGQQRPPQLTRVPTSSAPVNLSCGIFIHLHPWVPESPRSDSVVLKARWLSTTESMLISSCSLPCQTVNATLAEGIWRPSSTKKAASATSRCTLQDTHVVSPELPIVQVILFAQQHVPRHFVANHQDLEADMVINATPNSRCLMQDL